ncbi:hypothetical protein BDD12DRAFT_881350 [Trichophaea hybrida]|nr:hypothetical protein BDD12DRAFT_881350 [Trichophaea hybrida]
MLNGRCHTISTDNRYFPHCLPRLFAKFGMERNIELRILKRSAGPTGAGQAHFVHGHQLRIAKAMHLQTPGRVKIRGVAYAMRDAPTEGNVLVSIVGRGVGNVGRKLA